MATAAIRAARPEEAEQLSELALRSKGYWGYDGEFLEACRAELTVSAAACDGVHVVVAVTGETILGFAHIAGSPPRGELSALFVDPAYIGQGVGRQLLASATARAAALGFTTLAIDADPGAEAFYRRVGATPAGHVASTSIPGRLLPRLELSVQTDDGDRRPPARLRHVGQAPSSRASARSPRSCTRPGPGPNSWANRPASSSAATTPPPAPPS